jgi:tRNA(fMet)-specific endonuclease VapC
MILLDTDHLSVLVNRKAAGHASLQGRLKSSQEPVSLPVISVEEQCKGWLAKVHRARDVHQQVPAYESLVAWFDFLADWEIIPFQSPAAEKFKRWRKEKIRIGSQDLKIAAIAVTQQALLLSANLRDFRQVPNIRVENWLEASSTDA